MNFFERQAAARATSRRWVVLFAVAVFATVAAVDAVVVVLLSTYRQHEAGRFHDAAVSLAGGDFRGALILTSLTVLAVIAIASLYKTSVLSAGGSTVALGAGGERVLRETSDVAEKRLLNIVEEMAIASGVPMPEVYVLQQETGINAFAAGHAPANAAIAVTRGALDTLTRNELQGVIAHEFSHLLNGDMRLNIKLMGLLFGILVIALAGRSVLRFAPRNSGRKNGGADAVIFLTALAIMVIGYVGLFFGRLIQAAVARNRESLADASAVQFTRDPLGLRGALVKIGALESGSRLHETNADEIAHMLFAPGMSRMFATHPPLVSRLRALDPSFRESEFDEVRRKLAQQTAKDEVAQDETRPAPSRERLDRMIGGAVGVAPAAVAQLVGNPSPAHVATAQAIFASLPENIVQSAADTEAARGLFFALALDEEAEARARQLKFIGVQLGANVAASVEQWLPQAQQLNAAQRQPALLRLFPALRQLSEAERTSLLVCLTGLLQREGTVSIEKYALRKLAQLHLRESLAAPPLPGRATLDLVIEELALLFSILAQAGTDNPQEARLAYEAGMASLLSRSRPEFAQAANWPSRLDMALNKLDRLLPAAKELLVQALVKTVANDGKLTVQEAELLRTVCATLHCPLPPLIATEEH
jgi:Zn-dependent protease with chaperone function